MKGSVAISLAALSASVSASPTSHWNKVRANGTNPFEGYAIIPDSYYVKEITEQAIPELSEELAAAAKKVTEVGTFYWMDTADKVPGIGEHLAEVQEKNAAGADPPYQGAFVVYDLPDRDCAAAASNGEYSIEDGGVAKYKTYIDNIRKELEAYPDESVVLVIEPDSMANLITNLSVEKCANAEAAYRECTNYALKNLDLPNVSMYLDAGHSGWLGWPANIKPAAEMYGELYKTAGSPASVRGLALNVANYNAWTLESPPDYVETNPNYDEKKFVAAFGPLLEEAGFSAHFIVDTGRNGVQPTAQIEQGDWCNVIDTGFGVRPTSDTGDALVDAFVWVKPGGESDGTSDETAERYDLHCGLEDSLKPAPEAGQWFQAYFEQLLTNANPPF
ncbi:hypothetical protein FQN54_003152 [Arachnomyces sp. PD_36]|nr:hypothetical protein FQN54_003152 [Arachnomyces sp. PD_36]